MKFLSAIGAVYLGIYLVLPGCLCQLLGAFGVEISEGATAPRSCEVRGLGEAFACHCNDHELKKAEALTTTEFSSDVPNEIAEAVPELNPTSPPVSSPLSSGSRAPPPPARPWSSRAFSGVFLI